MNSHNNEDSVPMKQILLNLTDKVDNIQEVLNMLYPAALRRSEYSSETDYTRDFNDNVSKYIDLHKEAVERTAIPTHANLKEVWRLSGGKGTPPLPDRIVAVVNETRRAVGKDDLSVEEATEMMADLRSMAREVKAVCLTDGVAGKGVFGGLDDKYQLYYALLLEQRALREGIYLTKCKKQWAARALLAKTFKSTNDNKKRKEKAPQATNQLSTSGVKRFFPEDIDTPSPPSSPVFASASVSLAGPSSVSVDSPCSSSSPPKKTKKTTRVRQARITRSAKKAQTD